MNNQSTIKPNYLTATKSNIFDFKNKSLPQNKPLSTWNSNIWQTTTTNTWPWTTTTSWITNFQPQEKKVNKSVWQWAILLFSDEKTAYDKMLSDGLTDEKAREIITQRRKQMLWKMSQTEWIALIKMQNQWIDSQTAVEVVNAQRKKQQEEWKKENPIKNIWRQVYNAPVGALWMATEQVWNVIDFATMWKTDIWQQVKEVQATNRYLEDSTWAKVWKWILWAWEIFAVSPTKVAPTMLWRTWQWAVIWWLTWGTEPILSKWAEATAWDITKWTAIWTVTWAVATPVLEKAVLPALWKTIQKTLKYWTAWLKGWATWLWKSVVRDVKKLKPNLKKPDLASKISTKANRFTAWDERKFVKMTWQSPWEFATTRWMNKVWDEAVEEASKNYLLSMQQADDWLAKIKWTFTTKWQTDDILWDLVDWLNTKAIKQPRNPDSKRAKQLYDKYNKGWLTMPEINEAKRIYARNNTYTWAEKWSDAAKNSTFLQDDLRKWQLNKAEQMWFKNLKEINKNTQGWKSFADYLDKFQQWKQANNMFSITDVIALSWWNASNVALFVWKKMWSTDAAKRTLIKLFWKQKADAIIKANYNPSKIKWLLWPWSIKTPAPITKTKIKVTTWTEPRVIKDIKRLPVWNKKGIITPQTSEKAIIQESKLPLKKTKYGTNTNLPNNRSNMGMEWTIKSTKTTPKTIKKPTSKKIIKTPTKITSKIEKNKKISEYKKSAKDYKKWDTFTYDWKKYTITDIEREWQEIMIQDLVNWWYNKHKVEKWEWMIFLKKWDRNIELKYNQFEKFVDDRNKKISLQKEKKDISKNKSILRKKTYDDKKIWIEIWRDTKTVNVWDWFKHKDIEYIIDSKNGNNFKITPIIEPKKAYGYNRDNYSKYSTLEQTIKILKEWWIIKKPTKIVKPKVIKPTTKQIQTNLNKLTKNNIDDIASKITTDKTKLAQVKQIIKEHIKKYWDEFMNYMAELVDKVAEKVWAKINLLWWEWALKAPVSNLKRAKNMTKAWHNADDIWAKTGWEKWKDWKWRFEIDDSKAKISENLSNIIEPKKMTERISEISKKYNTTNNEIIQVYKWNNYWIDILEKKSKINTIKWIVDNLKKQWKSVNEIKSTIYTKDWYVRSNIQNKITKNTKDVINKINKDLEIIKWGDKKLSEILEHSDLYKQYPELKNYKVKLNESVTNNTNSDTIAYFDPKENYIWINLPNITNKEKFKSVLLHEIQHNIQKTEKFAIWWDINILWFEKYNALAWETEARNIQTRLRKPTKLRPAKTEDVARNKQIIRKDTWTSMLSDKGTWISGKKDLISEAKKFDKIDKMQDLYKNQAFQDLRKESDSLKKLYQETKEVQYIRQWRKKQAEIEKITDEVSKKEDLLKDSLQKDYDLILRQWNPNIDKLSEVDVSFLQKIAKETESFDEFKWLIRWSATQYWKYRPELRKYLTPEAKRLSDIKGINPDEYITVYRWVDLPKPKAIKEWDFVTMDFDDALWYTDSPSKVVTKRIKAKDLVTEYPEEIDVNDLMSYELIYKKRDFINITNTKLKEIFKQANK